MGWHLTAEPWIQSWLTSCEINGGQRDTGAGFPLKTTIASFLHTHLSPVPCDVTALTRHHIANISKPGASSLPPGCKEVQFEHKKYTFLFQNACSQGFDVKLQVQKAYRFGIKGGQ